MRIGIDLDGVCYDFAGSLRRYLVEHQGWSADACPAATRWEFYEDWGLTLKDFLALTAKGVDAGVIFTQGEPFRGTRAALERLKRAGHTLHVITDRSQGKPGVAQAATVEWLHRYQLPYDSITFSRDKTIVQTDAMIDDKLENYDALYRAGCHAYLYDRPWNQTTVWCRRVKNLARFAEVLT